MERTNNRSPRRGGPRWTRRQFLGIGAAIGASAALAGCGTTSTTSSPSASAKHPRYRSRPDLHPSVVSVRGPGTATTDGYVLVTPSGPLIVDASGEPIWIHPVPHASTDLKRQRFRGEPVLTWWQGEVASYGVGLRGECKIYDSAYRPIMTVRAKNGLHADLHEFIIDSDGTAYLTAYRIIDADLRAVNGPRRGHVLDAVIQGIDLESGAVTFEWHSADHLELTESKAAYKSGSAPYDPVHVNSIQPLSDGSLLVSARNTWTLYKIDRGTGEVAWRLGGKHSDFRLGPDVRFAWQHDARLRDDGTITLFDDEATPAEAKQSRGLVLDVDQQQMTATVKQAYHHPSKALLAGSQGSVEIMENGHVFIGWGAQPYFTELDANGGLVLDGSFSKGQSYRAYRVPWTGTPSEPPAIAVERVGGHHVTLYASWNGATEIESWRALGGPSSTKLDALRRVAKRGFETEIALETTNTHFAVEAIDSSGAVLGRSKVDVA